MFHIPAPQDQARILETALKETGFVIKHQDALELIAKVMGHKDWKTMSASFKAVVAKKEEEALDSAYNIPGPEDGTLYEATVTVDVTMSAQLRVRVKTPSEAKEALCELAHARFPRNFEMDEGNYRGVSDFYLGDEEGLRDIGTPKFEGDDMSASAEWEKGFIRHRVDFMRQEPDVSDDDRRAVVKVSLQATTNSGRTVCKHLSDQQYYGDLRDSLEEAIRESDFEEEFVKLVSKLTTNRRKAYKKKT